MIRKTRKNPKSRRFVILELIISDVTIEERIIKLIKNKVNKTK